MQQSEHPHPCNQAMSYFLGCSDPPSYPNAPRNPNTGPYFEGSIVTYSCTGGGGGGTGPVNCPAALQYPQCWSGGAAGGGTMVIVCQMITVITIPGQLEWRLQSNPLQPPPPSGFLGPPYCTTSTQGTCNCKYIITLSMYQ